MKKLLLATLYSAPILAGCQTVSSDPVVVGSQLRTDLVMAQQAVARYCGYVPAAEVVNQVLLNDANITTAIAVARVLCNAKVAK